MTKVSSDRIVDRVERVDRFFSEDVARFKRNLAALDAQIDPAAEPQRDDAFHHAVLAALEGSAISCARFEEENCDDPVVIRDVQQGFREETSPWMMQSWFGNRARTKPSGFAGDYEMLLKIYAQKTPARGLGGYLDLCMTDLPLARGVRARMKAAREFLIHELTDRSGPVRILDIACGPCQEFLGFPEIDGSRQIEVVGMDNDPKVLEYIQSTIVGGLPANMRFEGTRYNAMRTRSAQTNVRKFGRFDVIYSVGLFDYLSDDQLIPMLGALQDTLTDGGVMYLAFKDCRRYDKTPYQWHLDWFFYQRTEEDCRLLYQKAGIDPDSLVMTRDDTGIIITFASRRPQSDRLRADMAEQLPAPHMGVTELTPYSR